MEFLKKNGLVLLTLVLCAVLAGVLVRQSAEVSRLRAALAEEQRTAEALKERLDGTDAALQSLRSSRDRRLASVTFANPAVNTVDRLLTVDVIAELPEETERSLEIGFLSAGRALSYGLETGTVPLE